MARKLRVDYPGAIYHVLNRGDRREAIFRDDADRQRFVETLRGGVRMRGVRLNSCRVMSRGDRSEDIFREDADRRSEGIMGAELERLGGSAEVPAHRHEPGPVKVAIEAQRRQEATRLMADRLPTGSWKRARTRLQEWKRPDPTAASVIV